MTTTCTTYHRFKVEVKQSNTPKQTNSTRIKLTNNTLEQTINMIFDDFDVILDMIIDVWKV